MANNNGNTPERRYTTIWCDLIAASNLPPTQKWLATRLASYADYRTGRNARPGLTRLSADTGFARNTVIAALARLEERGLIRCTKRGTPRDRRASVYQLVNPGTSARDDLAQGLDWFERWDELVRELTQASSRNAPHHSETTQRPGCGARDELVAVVDLNDVVFPPRDTEEAAA